MIRVASEGVLDIVTMAGPRRNALSLAMMKELVGALRGCSGRVVILAADGPVFSAGHDLNEMVGCTAAKAEEVFAVCTELMETVQSIRQPVIAEVQGVATAAGCQLVAACDLAIASEDAWFATPGVKIGLFCSTPMVAVTRAIGRKRAMEMLLTGRQVPAHTAAEWGLVNRAVPGAELEQAVRELAVAVAAASEYTVSIGKRAFYEQIDMPQEEAYRFTRGVMERNAVADVAQEQMRAFLEKRGVR
ncbi:MAG: enoyl-CoA hydratase/isomerase family protein [Acidobacteria bacterium]|nr:enoyl-CoA hydratase/isomerase family protein [Acidobacteriota bacterium]